jgi:lysophospholipid acyltransferase (LPLAT)-like uncharacterized protein
MKRAVLAYMLRKLVGLWVSCLRYSRIGDSVYGPGLVVFWHGDQLALLGQRPSGELVAPISLSDDGSLQVGVMKDFGISAVRGSANRGAIGVVRGLLKALRDGAVCLIAVDGSRGPRREAKPGAIYLSQRSRKPIWVAGVAVARGHRLRRTWDHFLLPCPGTRTVVAIEGPWQPAQDADLNDLRRELESRLHAAQTSAESQLRHMQGK